MFSVITTGGVLGVKGIPIEVETKISKGLPQFIIVGLPDTAVKESKERVKSAIESLEGVSFPLKKVIVNLAPANILKQGTLYDLPIAIGILKAANFFNADLSKTAFIGELSLDGRIRKVSGSLPIAIMLQKNGIKNLILPEENEKEAAVVEGLNVFGFNHLQEVLAFLNKTLEKEPAKLKYNEIFHNKDCFKDKDMADVKGQRLAKLALEIAAAGFHNVLMIGSPGSGKSMLANRFPTIMPPLTFEEALETSMIHSVAGKLEQPLLNCRPFNSCHHTISDVALVGGGSVPKPGIISLSHNGALFMDELPEFKRATLEALRQPLEDKKVVISRATGTFEFPANFQLLAAANPCSCGYRLDKEKECTCSPSSIKKYLGKISGPLLDRIDMIVQIQRPSIEELSKKEQEESSKFIRERVIKAVERQKERFKGLNIKFNSQMSPTQVDRFVKLESDAEVLFKRYINSIGITARTYYKMLKAAQTLADLRNEDKITKSVILQIINFKSDLQSIN